MGCGVARISSVGASPAVSVEVGCTASRPISSVGASPAVGVEVGCTVSCPTSSVGASPAVGVEVGCTASCPPQAARAAAKRRVTKTLIAPLCGRLRVLGACSFASILFGSAIFMRLKQVVQLLPNLSPSKGSTHLSVSRLFDGKESEGGEESSSSAFVAHVARSRRLGLSAGPTHRPTRRAAANGTPPVPRR